MKTKTTLQACKEKCLELKWHFFIAAVFFAIILFASQFTNFSLLNYWYMFLVGIVIATIAMSSGVGGATFFVPFMILILNVPVASAIPIGIFVEIFGFTFGVYNYWKKKSIDYALAGKMILSASLFVILGVILNHLIKPTVVIYIFILALMIFATQLLINKKQEHKISKPFDKISTFIAGFGGFLLGFISSGMGEANEYNLFVRLKRKPAVVAGTSVLVVAVTAIIATATQAFYILTRSGFGTIKPYVMLITYSVLGTYFGANIGSYVAIKVDRKMFRKIISLLLYLVAIASLTRVLIIG